MFKVAQPPAESRLPHTQRFRSPSQATMVRSDDRQSEISQLDRTHCRSRPNLKVETAVAGQWRPGVGNQLARPRPSVAT